MVVKQHGVCGMRGGSQTGSNEYPSVSVCQESSANYLVNLHRLPIILGHT